MSRDVMQYLQVYQTTQRYLQLNADYCAHLGGVRWSDREDALVLPNGRLVAFNERVAEFLEGFATEGRIVSFCHVLHWLDLLQNLRDLEQPQVRRVAEIFGSAGDDWRNAGALAAVLSVGVPELPDPPRLDMICRRLRDRSFPIRWYAGRFHDSPDAPALAPADFEALVFEQLEPYSEGDLRTWFETGRGPLREPGAKLAPEPPAPRTLAGIVGELLQRPRLAGAETYVAQLVGAIAIPPRRRTPEELPLGGFADIVTHGGVEHLLPSQHALDDLEFLRRFAERELLFFRHEEPPAPQRQELAVLLDQGVRTWGDVRLVLAAAAIALARQAHARKLPFTLAATSNGGRPVDLLGIDTDALGRLVEASDLSPDPGLALETLLGQKVSGPFSAEAVAGGAPCGRSAEKGPDTFFPRDIVLLTEPRNLRSADVSAAARRLRASDRLFAVGLDRHGNAEVSELRRGAPIALRRFHIDFVPSRAAAPAVENKPEMPWQGDVEPIPFPFRLPVDATLADFDFDHDARCVVTCGPGLLHVWPIDGSGPECLPRPWLDGQLMAQIIGLLGVAGGFVLVGRLGDDIVLAHYDLVRHRCAARRVMPAKQLLPMPQIYYVRGLHTLIVSDPQHTCVSACDLDTGDTCTHPASTSPCSRAEAALLLLRNRQLLSRGRNLACVPKRYAAATAGVNWPCVCYVDADTGAVQLEGTQVHWPSSIPLSDGQPLLRGWWPREAQLGQNILALSFGRPLAGEVLPTRQAGIVVLRGPQAAVVREFPYPDGERPARRFQLSPDGRWIAIARPDHRVQIEPLAGGGQPFTTRSGALPQKPRLFVGKGILILSVGSKGQFWHVLDWTRGVLEHREEPPRKGHRTFFDDIVAPLLLSRRLLSAEATDESLPAAFAYDRERFIAGASTSLMAHQADILASASEPALDVALDRYGRVAVLDEARRLVCMFIAQRGHIAGWLPDGTRFGTSLLGGKAAHDAGAKFGRALVKASGLQVQ